MCMRGKYSGQFRGNILHPQLLREDLQLLASSSYDGLLNTRSNLHRRLQAGTMLQGIGGSRVGERAGITYVVSMLCI